MSRRRILCADVMDPPEDVEVVPTGQDLRDIIWQVEQDNPGILMIGDVPLVVLYDRVVTYVPRGDFNVH